MVSHTLSSVFTNSHYDNYNRNSDRNQGRKEEKEMLDLVCALAELDGESQHDEH